MNLEKFKKNQINNLTSINGGMVSTHNATRTKGDTFYYSNENGKTDMDSRAGYSGDLVWAVVSQPTPVGGGIN
jgi:hypothetical protein